jgi:hypothetical protein
LLKARLGETEAFLQHAELDPVGGTEDGADPEPLRCVDHLVEVG